MTSARDVIAAAIYGAEGRQLAVGRVAAEIISALESAGYVIVPVEPTEEMCAAAKKACGHEEISELLKVLEQGGMAHINYFRWTGDIEYRAMLAARPQDPS